MKTSETAMIKSSNTVKTNTEQFPNYDLAETHFETLLQTEALDQNLATHHLKIQNFEQTLRHGLLDAYKDSPGSGMAHQFLQRILYRINRLKLFWYDDLQRYKNESSIYLQAIRDQIEKEWQAWEMKSIDIQAMKKLDTEESLREHAARDLESEPSEAGVFFRDHAGEAGYRRLLEITSLDGLVEASQLSRMLGGVGNEIQSTLTKLFLEEYGGGRLSRKHSSFFETMLNEFGMRTEPEAYFNVVPWEVLAGINHSFLLSERKFYYLRYIGGLLYTEISVPSAYCHYSAAARRLNFPETAMGYWDLHVKEDKRHGPWMLYDVALPLALRYPADAWELVLGYRQQQLISQRSGKAIARAARRAELDRFNKKDMA